MRARRRWLWTVLQTGAQWLSIVLWRVRVFGKENLPPGGCLLASNHQSYLDPILVGVGLDREIHYMARTSLFRFPAFRALIVTLNAFSIERDSSDVKGVKEAIDRLRAGHTLVVFPEGTRTRDGQVGQPKSGLILLAQRASVPIVPVLIQGAFQVWSRHRPFPGMGWITVRYGKPLSMDSSQSRSDFSTAWTHALSALRPQEASRVRAKGDN